MHFFMLMVYFLVNSVTITICETISGFEFENVVGGPGLSRSPWRSNASKGSSLHMFKGDRIQLDLCVPEQLVATMKDLLYSNDGMADSFRVSLNDFRTFGETIETVNGWGRNWDLVKSHRFVPSKNVELDRGQHILEMEVMTSDCYGVEFDVINIATNIAVTNDSFFCGSRLIPSTNPPDCAPDSPASLAAAADSTTKQHAASTHNIVKGTRTASTTPTLSTSTQTTVPSMQSQTPAVKPTTPELSTSTQTVKPTTPELSTSTQTMKRTTPELSMSTQSMKSSTLKHSTSTQSTMPPTQSQMSAMKSATPSPSRQKQTTKSTTFTRATTTQSRMTTAQRKPAVKSTTPRRSTSIQTTSASTQSKRITTSKPRKPTTKKPIQFLKQLTVATQCLTNKNIRMRFNPTTLKGVKVIARYLNPRNIKYERQQKIDTSNICNDRIWQIGEFNNDNADLGPLRYTNIDHDVDAKDGSQMPFPGLINPQFTKTLILRYIVPNDVGRGNVYLTLGLVNVTAETTIGMQYHIGREKEPSEVKYVTLTPDDTIVGWDLPARSVSPSLKNVITLYFNRSMAPLKVDFLRLEYTGNKPKVKRENIFKNKVWRVVAFNYNQREAGQQYKGMEVTIDGQKKADNVQRIAFFYKPFRKSLTIYQSGKLFPHNELKASKEEEVSMLSEASGVTFGDRNNKIASVNYNSKSEQVKLAYNDRSLIRFSLNYTEFRTKLSIVESSISPTTVDFFSTYITDYVTAVNEVMINNVRRFDVTDKKIELTKDRRYTFLKTTPNKMYKVNDEYEFVFPKGVLPK